MRVLLSGASGFVGSHVLRHLLTNTDWEIVCPTTFSHKGLPARMASAICDQPWQERVTVCHWDMRSHADLLTRRQVGKIDAIWNIASESHVDRSISHPVPFVENNVSLILRALELSRLHTPKIFLQMSTDEVYGPATPGHNHREWEPVIPSNPYSASKAAQEAIAISYWRTYGVPLVITNTMNIIGEMQDPEKFLPKVIRSLRDGESIPVHVSPDGVPGSRFYLHARNLADAWLHLTRMYTDELDVGTVAQPDLKIMSTVPTYANGAERPARFHIVGDEEITNTDLVYHVGSIMGLDHYDVEDMIEPVSFHASRPGHDLRYALDGQKIAHTGWRAPVDFWDSLRTTVKWTLEAPGMARRMNGLEIILAHLFGDYVIQSDWMAIEKTRRWWPALVHAVTYGLPFLVVTRSPWALLVIIGTHAVIDRYRLARHVVWAKNLLAPKRYRHPWALCTATGYHRDRPEWLAVWLMIIADNALHLTINTASVIWL